MNASPVSRTRTPAPSYFEHQAGAPELEVIDIPGMLVTELHVSEVCERDSDSAKRCSKCGALDTQRCQL